eukprot:scaffold90542_cov69-Phaeocystis_antarctica.AAC.3
MGPNFASSASAFLICRSLSNPDAICSARGMSAHRRCHAVSAASFVAFSGATGATGATGARAFFCALDFVFFLMPLGGASSPSASVGAALCASQSRASSTGGMSQPNRFPLKRGEGVVIVGRAVRNFGHCTTLHATLHGYTRLYARRPMHKT